MIVTSPTGNTTPATVLANATSWQGAVTDLVAWLVSNNRCFSSGEIAAYLRTYRSDLAFRVAGVGDQIRDAYDSGSIPSYDDGQGGSVYPVQVARVCNGVATTLDGRLVHSRTPVGTTVFVYAPDGVAGFAHDFEIFIPEFSDPSASQATLYTGGPLPVPTPVVTSIPSTVPGAAPVVSAPPTPAVGVLITGALSRDDVTAYVRPDGRLCVPRAAFEAFVALTGVPLRGGPAGDPVYVTFTPGNEVSITRTPSAGATKYHLWANRGRIAIPRCPGLGAIAGNKFAVAITTTALTVNLSTTV